MLEIEKAATPGFEDVTLCRDEAAGLRAIVAVHDTSLGPAVGGTRMLPYESEEKALADVLRLARAMTYKAAASELSFGGGKAVIIGDPQRDKTEALLRAFGALLERLAGAFITGEDVGTTAEDMLVAGTRYAIYPPKEIDPEWETAFLTAFGVLHGIRACAKEALGTDSLKDTTIALQGLGKVGERLARMLRSEGAALVVTDVDPARLARVAAEVDARTVPVEAIYDVAAEVFCPCALGGVVREETIARLKCKVVAGAANNQLAEERHGAELWRRGILYAPDYVINAGGLISALYEMGTSDRADVMSRTERVYDRLGEIFRRSRAEQVPPSLAADKMVEDRLARARQQRAPRPRRIVS